MISTKGPGGGRLAPWKVDGGGCLGWVGRGGEGGLAVSLYAITLSNSGIRIPISHCDSTILFSFTPSLLSQECCHFGEVGNYIFTFFLSNNFPPFNVQCVQCSMCSNFHWRQTLSGSFHLPINFLAFCSAARGKSGQEAEIPWK